MNLARTRTNLVTRISSQGPLLYDTFTDANGTLLSAHTPDVGGPWIDANGSGTNQLRIQSDGTVGVPNATGLPIAVADVGVSDFMVAVDIPTGGNSGLVVFRYVDNQNYLRARHNTNALTIMQVVAGVSSTLLNKTIGALADPYTMTVTCHAHQITLTAGSETLIYSTSQFNTATKVGMEMDGSARRFDNFLVEPLAGGAPPPQQALLNITMLTTSEETNDWFGRAVIAVREGVAVMVYHAGTAHTAGAEIRLRFSSDGGVTWTDDNVYPDGTVIPAFEYADEPYILLAPNGDLLLQVYKSADSGIWQWRSTDGGKTWSSPALIDFVGSTDEATIRCSEDHTVVNGVIYLGLRDVTNTNQRRRCLAKSDDNGVTWTFVANIEGYDGVGGEWSIEYIGNDTFISIFRAAENDATYRAYSDDLGETWTALEDITHLIPAMGRPRLWTKSHLQSGDDAPNWWQDTILVLIGYVYVGSGRRNAIWTSPDHGVTWSEPFYVDGEYLDAGYGTIFYRGNNEYVYVNYVGTLNAANLVQYDVRLLP